MRLFLSSLAVIFLATLSSGGRQAPSTKAFNYREVMIPVRDGVQLQTVILTPVDQSEPLPILFRRTPYGVWDKDVYKRQL